MSNRLADETSPYLRQHGDNPVDWYPWGDDAFALRAGARQAGVPVGRLLVVPLVPRHGARIVRGRRDRGAHERAVREREGRPRRTPGRRRGVHASGAGAHRPRRLAHERVVHPRTAARSTAARTTRTRNGTACRRSSACCEAVAEAWNERREEVLEHASRLTEAIDEQVMRPETTRSSCRAQLLPRGVRQHRAPSSSRSTAASAPRRSSRRR